MGKTRVLGVVAALAVGVSACGDDGPAAGGVGAATPAGTPDNPRTIEIAMVDIAFEPAAIEVRSGETVRFHFTNEGAVEHEATFGDETEQEEHAAEMREAEDMDGSHGDEAGHDDETGDEDHGDDDHGDGVAPLVLEPGASGEVLVTFDDPDVSSTIIGCHVPGHWEAGMRLDVSIASA